jgi:hypothetical protein
MNIQNPKSQLQMLTSHSDSPNSHPSDGPSGKFLFPPESPKKNFAQTNLFNRMLVYLRNFQQDFRQNKCFFMLGVFTIMFCLFCSMTSEAIITECPRLFLSEAVKKSGDIDIIFSHKDTGSQLNYQKYLNNTAMTNALYPISNMKPSGRIPGSGTIYKRDLN